MNIKEIEKELEELEGIIDTVELALDCSLEVPDSEYKEYLAAIEKRKVLTAELDKMKKNKPDCKLIGEDGNIFNLIGIASRTLRENGMAEEAVEMRDRIRTSENYDEALCIIGEYVAIV